jgi:hypothetical protein
MRLDEGGSRSDGDGNVADLSHEEDSQGNISEREEDNMDDFMDAIGSDPKAKEDIHSWEEL